MEKPDRSGHPAEAVPDYPHTLNKRICDLPGYSHGRQQKVCFGIVDMDSPDHIIETYEEWSARGALENCIPMCGGVAGLASRSGFDCDGRPGNTIFEMDNQWFLMNSSGRKWTAYPLWISPEELSRRQMAGINALVPEKLLNEAKQYAEAACGDITGLGACHAIWTAEQVYLAEKGYVYYPPRDLYPHIIFD